MGGGDNRLISASARPRPTTQMRSAAAAASRPWRRSWPEWWTSARAVGRSLPFSAAPWCCLFPLFSDGGGSLSLSRCSAFLPAS